MHPKKKQKIDYQERLVLVSNGGLSDNQYSGRKGVQAQTAPSTKPLPAISFAIMVRMHH